jgi:hypothetical protein
LLPLAFLPHLHLPILGGPGLQEVDLLLIGGLVAEGLNLRRAVDGELEMTAQQLLVARRMPDRVEMAHGPAFQGEAEGRVVVGAHLEHTAAEDHEKARLLA